MKFKLKVNVNVNIKHTQQIRQLEIDPGDGSNPSKSNASGRMNRIIHETN